MLVFDEPTAVLTPQETDELMGIMRQLKEAGKAIVFITHKLREVREVADRITVIRRGKVVGEAEPTATNAELAALMVGRPVELIVRKGPPKLGEDALVVDKLRVIDLLGHVHVDDLSFTIKRGEVLAVAGVQGNGQTELTEALLGLQDHVTGSITLDGKRAGRALGAQDPRRRRGVHPGGPPGRRPRRQHDHRREPDAQPQLRRALRPQRLPAARQARRVRQAEAQGVRRARARHHAPMAGNLSGGNQQKVVVARELSRDLRLLVAAQPTRGVDVGSIEFIHTQIVAARDSGVPVLVVSTELDEVVALADRIMVLYRGRIVGIVPPDTPREVLGLMMTGERPEGAVA